MKIKPYYKWPKLSTLKRGDKIRVRNDGFNEEIDGMDLCKFNNKMVTLKLLGLDVLIQVEEFGNPGWWWIISRFEIDTDHED